MPAFLRSVSAKFFLSFTALYAVAMGFVFWGTWSLDVTFVQPDNATSYAVDDASRWFAGLLAGGRFIPIDLIHVLGGMYFWQELQYALAAYLAALAVVFYLRFFGLSLTAQYAAGAAYGLMGYNFTLYSAGHLGWFYWLMCGPFAFGLIDRCIAKGKLRNWVLLGAVLAWSGAQQPDMWLLFSVLAFVYGIVRLCSSCVDLSDARKRVPRVIGGAVLAFVAMLLVGYPQISAFMTSTVTDREKQIAQTSGKGDIAEVSDAERWNFCTNWSLPPEDMLEFLIPDVHGGSSDMRISPKNPYRGRIGMRHPSGQWIPYRQHSLYFGFLTVLFALVAVCSLFRKRNGIVIFWTSVAAVTCLCALGCFTPFYRLVYSLPYGNSIRCPIKFVHLMEFAAAILAGFGTEALLRRFAYSRSVVLVVSALAILNVIDLARVDARYCAVEDVTFMKAANDAAVDALASGGGTVFVSLPPQNGGDMVRISFSNNGIEADGRQSPETANFFFLVGSDLRNAYWSGKINSGSIVPMGYYTIHPKNGIKRVADRSLASAVLMKAPAAPTPTKEKSVPSVASRIATALSVLSTFAVLIWALAAVLLHGRKLRA